MASNFYNIFDLWSRTLGVTPLLGLREVSLGLCSVVVN